jgi:hypothetical protein
MTRFAISDILPVSTSPFKVCAIDAKAESLALAFTIFLAKSSTENLVIIFLMLL